MSDRMEQSRTTENARLSEVRGDILIALMSDGRWGGDAAKIRAVVMPVVTEYLAKARFDALREAKQIADETTDSLGTLYRLDYLDRLDHELEAERYTRDAEGDGND